MDAYEEKMAAKVARLPKWAQTYIEGKDRKLAELEARVAALSEGGPEDTNVRTHDYVYPNQLLARDAAIDFRVGEDWEGSTIQVQPNRREPDILEVSTHNTSKVLAVTPWSGNVLHLRLIPRSKAGR